MPITFNEQAMKKAILQKTNKTLLSYEIKESNQTWPLTFYVGFTRLHPFCRKLFAVRGKTIKFCALNVHVQCVYYKLYNKLKIF